jgi:hypothetical protein
MVRNAAQSPDVSGGGSAAAAASSSYGMSTYSQGASKQTVELVWKRAGKDLVAFFEYENNAMNTLRGI